MSESSKLFRKVSLERLSSPEQLDQMMEVTTPKGWLALVTVLVVLGAAIIWGFLGNLPSSVQGQGILIRGGNVLDVEVGSGGRVTEILVREGEVIEADQKVARLAQTALETRIINSRSQLESYREHDAILRRLEDENRELELAALAAHRNSIQDTISNLEPQVEFLRSRIEDQESLVESGLITRAAILETQGQLFYVLQELATARAGLQELEVARLNAERLLEQERNARQLQIEQARLQIEELEGELERSSFIVSPHRGRVIQIMADVGSVTHQGQRFLTLEQEDRPLSLVAFVPPHEGKKVQPGMTVNITPTTVKAEEHGHLLGKVTHVSPFPSTPQGMMRVLRNEGLVHQMSMLGSPIAVEVEPLRDPETGRFQWTSRKGPEQEVVAGTMAFASVVVEQRKPITMVIPLLRKWFLGVETPESL